MEFVNRIRIEALRSQESFQLGKFERTLLIPGTQSKFDIHYPESFVRLILFEPSRFRARSFPNSVNLNPWKVFPPSTFIRLFRYSFRDQSGLFFIAIISLWRHAICFSRMCSLSRTSQIVWEKNWFIGVDNFLIEIVKVNLNWTSLCIVVHRYN